MGGLGAAVCSVQAPEWRAKRSDFIWASSVVSRSTLEDSLSGLVLYLGGASAASAARGLGRVGWAVVVCAGGRPPSVSSSTSASSSYRTRHDGAIAARVLRKALPQMLEAKTRGAKVMAILWLQRSHTGVTAVKHSAKGESTQLTVNNWARNKLRSGGE